MNTLSLFAARLTFDPDLCLRWTITLLHSLWQGATIAMAVSVTLWCLRRSSARARYGVALCGLLLTMACLPITLTMVEVPAQASRLTGSSAREVDLATTQSVARSLDPSDAKPAAGRIPVVASAAANRPVQPGNESLAPAHSSVANETRDVSRVQSGQRRPFTIGTLAPFATAAYLFGVAIMLLRLALALKSSARLSRSATVVDDPQLLACLRQRAQAMGLRVLPVLLRCEQVAVPIVMGLVKPLVLIPGSMVTGLDPREFEAILTHELAHLRRLDLAVNLLQRVVESLLFFHPAVWYLSRCVSLERENCCDDLVLAAGHERLQYAGALIRMAEISGKLGVRDSSRLAALAANGAGPSELKVRVLRLLGSPVPVVMTRRGLCCATILMLCLWCSPVVVRQLLAESGKVSPALPASQSGAPAAAVPPAKAPEKANASTNRADRVKEIEDLRRRLKLRRQAAANVAEALRKKSFQSFFEQFTPELKQQLTEQKFTEVWTELVVKCGELQDADERSEETYGTETLHSIRLRWKTDRQHMLLDLDSDNKIAGLWIPHPGKLPGQDTPADYIFGSRIAEIATWKHTLEVTVLGLDGQPVPKSNVLLYREVSDGDQIKADDRVDTDTGRRWRAATGASGGSSVTGTKLRPGWYRAVVRGGHDSTGPVGISPPVQIEKGELAKKISVQLQPGGTVRVTAVSQEDGKALETPHFELERIDQTWPSITVRPAKGDKVWIYDQIPAGKYLLSGRQQARSYKYLQYESAQKTELEVQTGETRDVQLVLTGRPLTAEEVSARAPWIVNGRVTDSDGQPVAGAEIWASAGWGTLSSGVIATTDADGRYLGRFSQSGVSFLHEEQDPLNLISAQIGAYKPGLTEVNLNRQGGMHACNRPPTDADKLPEYVDRKRIFIKGQPREVNFQMTRSAQVNVRVVDEQGQPFKDQSVWLDGKELPPASSVVDSEKTNAEGQATFKDVPGNFGWWVELRQGRQSFLSRPMKFQGGQQYQLSLRKSVEAITGLERLEIASAVDSAGTDVKTSIIVDDPFSRDPVDAAQQEAGRDILKKVREVNRYWLAGPPPEVKSYSYEFHLRDRGAQKVTVDNTVKGAIYLRRGISYYSTLDYITANPDKVIFRMVSAGPERIELVYSFKERVGISAGNGVAGSWAGYFSSGAVDGKLIVDAKTHQPLELHQGENVDIYSNYAEVRPGLYVPLRIQVGKMGFDWQFKFHEPGLWLFDKLSKPLDDGKTVSVTNVTMKVATQD